jgi:hypothetical protein
MKKPDEKRQGMKVRTVVTGHDAKGRAVFVRDEQVDGTPIPGLGELAFLWNADEPSTYPNAGNNPAAPGIFPPVGGIRYIIGTYLPGVIAPEPTPAMHLEDGDEPGGANDGFHRTDTTDFGVSLPFNPSRCSEDRLRPFVRSTDLGSDRTPRVDPRVPCGVSDARRRKTEANRADRLTGALRVAGPPPRRSDGLTPPGACTDDGGRRPWASRRSGLRQGAPPVVAPGCPSPGRGGCGPRGSR